jgi:hypothetical protein
MNDKILKIKKSTLVDIANEVRTKTGSTDLIKIADLDDAIKNISGGSNGVLIEYDSSTVLPNTGTIEQVYVNTNLSNEEVEGCLSQLTYDEDQEYLVLDTDTIGLLCVGLNGMYFISDSNFNIIWCNEAFFNQYGSHNDLTYYGWQEFTNPIEINSEI